MSRTSRLALVRAELKAVEDAPHDVVTPERAVDWLRAFDETWEHAELPAEQGDLLHAICERIDVAGRAFIQGKVTPSAETHGVVLALPQVVTARPAGVGRAITTYDMPIEVRDEWLAAAARHFA